jgi:tetratricopeptide (TPR) repeat protein
MIKMRDFYSLYPINNWQMKLIWYKHLLINQNEIINQIESENINLIPNKDLIFRNMINLDIHILQFQVIEALFCLIFALEDLNQDFTWFNLTFPKDSSKRSLAAYDRISYLNKGFNLEHFLIKNINYNSKSFPIWQFIFFFGINFEKIEKKNNYDLKLDKIFKNISKLLGSMARIFSDRDDYNAYKHGLRLYVSNNASISFRNENELGIPEGPIIQHSSSKHVLTYLSKDQDSQGIFQVYEKTKSFSPNEDLFYIENAIKLIQNIIDLRNTQKVDKTLHFFENFEFYHQTDYTLISQSWSITSENHLLNQCYSEYEKKNYKSSLFFGLKVLQLNSKNYEAIRFVGYSHYKLKEYKKAVSFLEKYIKNLETPHYYEVMYHLALNSKHLSKNRESLKYLAKIINDKKNVDEKILNLAYLMKSYLKIHQNAEIFKKTKKNNERYIRSAQKSLQIVDPDMTENPQLWLNIAEVFEILKKQEDAIIIFQKLHLNDPNNIFFMFKLGNILVSGPNPEEGGNIYQKIIDLDPTSADGWNNLGMYIFEYKNEINLAEKYVEKAFELKKKFLYLKNLYKIKKKKEDPLILEEFKNMILNSDNFEFIFEMSGIYFFEKIYDESMQFIKKASEIEPDSFRINTCKGLILINQNFPKKALKYFLRCFDIQPKNASVTYNISCCYAKLLDVQNTIHWIEQAIILDKKFLRELKIDNDFDEIRKNTEFSNNMEIIGKKYDI